MVSPFLFLQVFVVTSQLYNIVLGKTCYVPRFSEDVVPCDDFENKVMITDDLKVGGGGDDEGKSVGLIGHILLKEAIVDGFEIGMKAEKETEHGKEFVFNAVGNICDNLDNKDAPWYSLMASFNVTSCPIPADLYDVTMIMSIGFADDVMCHEYCAEYSVMLTIAKDEGLQEVACYVVGVAIAETTCDDDE